MSGPVTAGDAPASEHDPHLSSPPTFELISSRSTEVGGMSVLRALPRRARRTIGAWCFLDHFSPARPGDTSGMRVGPHPHIGLQTVTWLTSGAVDHSDSLGVHQRIHPGQLNLMTAGAGVAHAEQTPDDSSEPVTGAQLWIALDHDHRHAEARFEHHEDLPRVPAGELDVTLLVGKLAGERSPARVHSPLVGAAVAGSGSGALELNPAFEHGLVVLEGAAEITGAGVEPASLAYLGRGRENLELRLAPGTQALLIGGEPLSEEPLMWWNFVAADWEEIRDAVADWESGSDRFGTVESPLEAIGAPALPS